MYRPEDDAKKFIELWTRPFGGEALIFSDAYAVYFFYKSLAGLIRYAYRRGVRDAEKKA
jgi:hypothetical protein